MSSRRTGLLDILLMASLFAPSFIFTKIAIRDISPITLITLRVGFAGLLLLGALKLRKITIPRELGLWKYCFALGFFLSGFPFVLFSYSLGLIPTSLAALLNGMTPIVTIFLANLALEDERLTIHRTLGVMLGLLGFLVLFLPSVLGNPLEFNLLGILLSFGGACSYAIGAIIARKYVRETPPLVAPTLQLLTSLVYLVPAALIFENPTTLAHVHSASWAALMGVSIFGTALAFIVYHKIVSQHGATFVSMATYLLPVFGTILGVIFLNETLSLNFILAALLILSGLGILNGRSLPSMRLLKRQS